MKYLKILLTFIGSCLILLSVINRLSAQEANSPLLVDFSQTNATLTPNFMVNNQLTTADEQQWVASDKINLSATIKVAQEDVAQEGALYVVMLWNNSVFMMKDDKGNWQPWSGDFNQLVASTTTTLSESEIPVEVISGLGGLTGSFVVYVGYQNTQSKRYIYNNNPITFTVQSVQEVMSTSLHGTTRGMGHFYSADQGGFEQFTHIPYEDLTCQSCHIEATACTTCHEVPGDTPDNAKCLDTCHKRQQFEQQFNPDHHLMPQADGGLEMNCASCHSAKQMHGDGKPYSSLHNNPTKVDCQQSGCHTNVTIAGKTMHETHIDELECDACHVKNTMTCYSCHFADGSAYQPPITDWKILVKKESTGKITTGNIQTMAADGNTFLVVAPFFGHTIQKDSGINCSTCHNSPAIQEYKEHGTMTLATWNDENQLENMTGVIPIPRDWQTALKVEFIAKDDTDQWTLQKSSIDATQMLFAEPIDVKEMPKF